MVTSKQRAMLRAQANTLDASVYVGQNGITETVLGQIGMNLDSHKLVKIAILQNCDIEAKQIIGELASVLGAEPVQAIGRKVVLYRYSSKCKNHVKVSTK